MAGENYQPALGGLRDSFMNWPLCVPTAPDMDRWVRLRLSSPFLAVRCTSAPTDSTWSEAVTASGKNMPPRTWKACWTTPAGERGDPAPEQVDTDVNSPVGLCRIRVEVVCLITDKSPTLADMVAVWIAIGLLVVLVVAVFYDTRRRRRVLEGNLQAGISRGARRTILREQRAQERSTQAEFNAKHPYMLGGGSDGGGI